MVFQNLIMEGVESRKNVRKTVEQTMWKLTNKETFTMLCSVVKHAGGGLEHERSVRGNTRRSRMFLSTSWVLTLILISSLFFLPRLHSLLALCVRPHHSNLVLLACCFSLSSFWLAKCSPQRFGKACVRRRQIYSYMYVEMQSSKQGMWKVCHLSMEDMRKEQLFWQKCYIKR